MLVSVALVAAGLVALTVGAEALVRGAAGLATRVGVSALVVGLTVVSFGTSSPELAVSLRAALGGSSDVGVGNVVGSNVFNVLFVLGASALVTPLVVHRVLVRRDVPVMIGVSLAAWWMMSDGAMGRTEGVALLAGVLAYAWWMVRGARRERRAPAMAEAGGEAPAPGAAARGGWGWQIGLVVVGVGLCVAGSWWLVDGAVAIARSLGVAEFVIGATIVAAGTSLPEAATSIVAAARGQRDIAVGSVVGSNLFNLLSILGLCAAVSPAPIEVSAAALSLDVPVMVAAALVCLPVCVTGLRIERWEGAAMLGLYAAYLGAVIAGAAGAGGGGWKAAVVWAAFAMPTILVAGSAIGWLRRRGGRARRAAGQPPRDPGAGADRPE